MLAWVNGKIVDASAPQIRLNDHGFTVADGVFETLKTVRGRPFALDRHVIASALEVEADDLAAEMLSIAAPFQIRRRGVETRIIAGEREPAPDQTLIQALAKAHRWMSDLKRGKPLSEIARLDGHSGSFIRLRAQLAFLSPRIQAAILDGAQPPGLSLEKIIRTGAPLDWSEQERIFGFNA